MTEHEALKLARQELERCAKTFRRPFLRDYGIRINKRMKRTHMLGKHHGPPKNEIHLAANHVARDPFAEVRDTILHEIAHALAEHCKREKGIVSKRHHDKLFYDWCRKVGAQPRRCANFKRQLTIQELPQFTVECGCFRKTYKRLPQEYRTDDAGRVFHYFWRRHEFWATQADYVASLRSSRLDTNAPTPAKVEYELVRFYFGCIGKHYVGVEPCNGDHLYLHDYRSGVLATNYKVDDVPPKAWCGTFTSHVLEEGSVP